MVHNTKCKFEIYYETVFNLLPKNICFILILFPSYTHILLIVYFNKLFIIISRCNNKNYFFQSAC